MKTVKLGTSVSFKSTADWPVADRTVRGSVTKVIDAKYVLVKWPFQPEPVVHQVSSLRAA